MLSMIYMNLRRNDAADAFCKNIPVRRQYGRIYLVFSLDCWDLGLFATSLMWTDEVGRWLFEMSIISCSMPLSGHRRHIITIFLILGGRGGVRGFSSFWRVLGRVRVEYKYTMYLLLLVLSPFLKKKLILNAL